jgi:hypothetical protein
LHDQGPTGPVVHNFHRDPAHCHAVIDAISSRLRLAIIGHGTLSV